MTMMVIIIRVIRVCVCVFSSCNTCVVGTAEPLPPWSVIVVKGQEEPVLGVFPACREFWERRAGNCSSFCSEGRWYRTEMMGDLRR